MDIILASQSPRRRELLEKSGIKFRIVVSNVDENVSEKNPMEYVKKISYRKALAVFNDNKDDIVIGADTIVVLDDLILGKPKDYDDAYNTLLMLNNRSHKVITGVSILSKNKEVTFCVSSDVLFKNNSVKDIKEYILTNEPMDKAGSYAIQGIGRKLIKSYKGSLDNIIGLPVESVMEALKEF